MEETSRITNLIQSNNENSVQEPNMIWFGRDVGMSRDQLIVLVTLSLGYFYCWAYFSLFAPFFPEAATEKQLNSTEIGIIFGIIPFVLLIFSPIFGKYMNTIGLKFLVVSGFFLSAGSMILFGLIDLSPGGFAYFFLANLTRFVTALGSSMSLSYATIVLFFPKNIAFAVSILEVFTGLGLMVGPVIGGILFEYGGFSLPFYFMGGLMAILFLVSFFIFPSPQQIIDEDNRNLTLPILPLLKIPLFDLTLLMLFCGSLAANFVEPSIQLHLLPLNLTPVELGFVFLTPALMYVIFTPIIGYLCDKYPKLLPLFILLSAFESIIAYSFFGPLPLLKMKLSLPSFLFGYIVFGISYSGLLVPVYAEMTKIAQVHGYPNDLRTQGIISGVFTSVYSSGALIGPIIGGIIIDYEGFDESTYVIIFIFILATVLYTIELFKNASLYNGIRTVPSILDLETERLLE